MAEDQRFASQRADVLLFESTPLEEDITVAGDVIPSVWFSTTSTDVDLVVKLIDVLPYDTPDNDPNPGNIKMGGYQMPVRMDIMRCKYLNGLDKPKALVPGKITKAEFAMGDVNHTFKKSHRIMVQIQSSWFPLFDRNPQTFCDIYNAAQKDFQDATVRIYTSPEYPSLLKLRIKQ